MIHFDSPLFFFLLLFLPIFWDRKPSDKTSPITLSSDDLLFSARTDLRACPVSWRVIYRRPILNLLRCLAFCFLVIGLSRPQTGNSYTEIEASGRDIMLSLDISGSMLAMDFFIDNQRVDRLSALKEVVGQFIDGRKNDRMGLVVFSESVFTQCPLTLDHQVLKDYLNAIQVGMAGKATAIGDGITVALKRLKDIEGESKVIVLVSDGKSNAGSVDPLEAAKLAAKLGIKIHVVGIGSEGYAPMPTNTIFGGIRLVNTKLDFDEVTLKEIAKLTGGEYFNAKDTAGLVAVYKSIDRLEERSEQSFQYVEYEEQFLPFLLIGLMCLITFEVLSFTIFRVIPPFA